MASISRDLARAALRGGVLGLAAWAGFFATQAPRGTTGTPLLDVANTWGIVGLSLAVPLFVGLRVERPPRAIPPLGTLALVFGLAFVATLFGLFEGAYFATVRASGLSQGFVVVGQLAGTLREPYTEHAWWRAVLPWYDLWHWWDDPRAPVDTALVVASLVTIHVAARWLGGEGRARSRSVNGLRIVAGIAPFVASLVPGCSIEPDSPPYSRRFTSLQGFDESVALALFGLGAAIALSLVPLVDRAFPEDPELEPGPVAPPRHRLSWMRAGLAAALALAGIVWSSWPEKGLLAKGYFHALAASPDGSLVAAAQYDEVIVWSGSGDFVTRIPISGYATALAFSPDGTRLALNASGKGRSLGEKPQAAEVWSLLDRRLAFRLGPEARGLSFSPDGERIYASTPAAVGIHSARDGAELGTLPRLGSAGPDSAGPLATGGPWVFASLSPGVCLTWDARDRSVSRGHLLECTSVAVAPDAARVAWVSRHTIEVRRPDGTLDARLATRAYGSADAAFSPDGARLVLACDDRNLRIVRIADGALVATLEGHRQRPLHVVWTKRGRIFSAGEDGVRIRDAP